MWFKAIWRPIRKDNIKTNITYEEFYILDITPCGLLKVNRRFGGTCHLHLQGRKISQERNQSEAGSKQSHRCENLKSYITYVKSIIFWDMTPCSPLSFNRRFGGTYRLHLQGGRNGFSKPASKQVAGLPVMWEGDAVVYMNILYHHFLPIPVENYEGLSEYRKSPAWIWILYPSVGQIHCRYVRYTNSHT
jgi:hypothetical protein